MSGLLDLSFRGVSVPCQLHTLDFSHAQVEHNQPGVDGGNVEDMARKSAKMSFRVPFHNLISWPKKLYPDVFRDFWNACLDRSVGPFVHPEFGELDAKVENFKVTFDPNLRDGYDVDVSFIESTENGVTVSDNPIGPVTSALALMQDFLAISGNIDPTPTYDDGSGDDPLTALKKLQGALLLAQLSVQDKLLQVSRVTGAINSMLDTVDSATSADAWLGRDILATIAGNLQDTADSLGVTQSKKKIDYVVAAQDIIPRDAASRAGMSVEAFYKLNPRAASKPIIAAGSEYFIEVG